MLTSYKRPKGEGQLTEDFEHSGGICDPSGTSGDLAVEDKLIGRLNRGDGQGEVLSDSDPPSQRGAIVAFSLATLEAESHPLPGSLLLLLDGQTEGDTERRWEEHEE